MPAKQQAPARFRGPALAAATPVDGADAVALWAAAQTLDLLDALAGRDVETPLRSAPFDGLIARRAEPLRLASLGTLVRGIARGAQTAADFDAAFARATRGGPRFETQVAARLAAPFLHGRDAAPPADEPVEPLTAREREILELLAAGLTNREIAQRLVLSARTVETHVSRITGKLGVNSRARAVARAVARGILGAAREYHTL
jgi:DNA-binding NarL/FixJ family response regulator